MGEIELLTQPVLSLKHALYTSTPVLLKESW